MKMIWLRLAAVIFMIPLVTTILALCRGEAKEPVVAFVYGFPVLILIIVASLGDTLEKRIAKLEDKLSGSETDA
jgi:hypothetical protein